MDLDTFIIATLCLIDDTIQAGIPQECRRQRGPASQLTPSEVLTILAVGEYLGLDLDLHLSQYFRTHYAAFFPALAHPHRTSFTRQAANWWGLTAWAWQRLADASWHDDTIGFIDSLPTPVCRFARAKRCRRLLEESAFGKDPVARQTFWGVRTHVRIV